jgi:S1-C subfamily serine protease
MVCSRQRIGATVLTLVAALFVSSAAVAGMRGAAAGGKTESYLGIAFHDVSDGEVAPMHLKDAHGAEIVMVDHDGPAGKAGLREHDVVLSLNGNKVESGGELKRMLHEMKPGQQVSLYICRGGSEQTLTATLASKSEMEKHAWLHPWESHGAADQGLGFADPDAGTPSRSTARGFIEGHILATPNTGLELDTVTPQLAEYFGARDGHGLLISSVENDSPAALAGLRAGDLITHVDGQHVASKADWSRTLRAGKNRQVVLTVMRDHHEQSLTLQMDSKKRSWVDAPQAASPWAPRPGTMQQ